MWKKLAAVVLVAVSLITGGCAVNSQHSYDVPEAVVAWANSNVYQVLTNSGSGSGFFLTEDTFITACHVVSWHEKANLVNQMSTDVIEMDVVSCNEKTDVAVLKPAEFAGNDVAPDLLPSCLLFDPRDGTAVWGAGYPLGDTLMVTMGHIQKYSKHNNDRRVITSATIMGDSGSPAIALINGEPCVAGLRLAIRIAPMYSGFAVIPAPMTHMVQMGTMTSIMEEIHKNVD